MYNQHSLSSTGFLFVIRITNCSISYWALVRIPNRSAGQFFFLDFYLIWYTRFLLLSDICEHYIMGRPARREDGSVIYSKNSMSLSRQKSRRTNDHILMSHLKLLGSLFVASYDLKECGGGILTRLHTEQQTGMCCFTEWDSLIRTLKTLYFEVFISTYAW
jgi:hypothetical protein